MYIRDRFITTPSFTMEGEGAGGGAAFKSLDAAGAGAGDAAAASAAAAAAAAAAGAGSGAGDAKAAPDAAAAAAAAAAAGKAAKWWPDDWTTKVAGEDKGWENELKRQADPAAALKAAREIVRMRDAGELKAAPKALAADATEAQREEWRKAQGLPAKAEDYVAGIKLGDGKLIGEADKPIVGAYAKTAADLGLTPAQFNGMVGRYYDLLAEQGTAAATARATKDVEVANKAIASLATEWGGNFATKRGAVDGALVTHFDAGFLTGAFAEARLPDGTKLMAHPGFQKGMASLALTAGPQNTDTGRGGGDGSSQSSRIAEIKGWLAKPGSDKEIEYRRNPALQQEYRDLIDAEIRRNPNYKG